MLLKEQLNLRILFTFKDDIYLQNTLYLNFLYWTLRFIKPKNTIHMEQIKFQNYRNDRQNENIPFFLKLFNIYRFLLFFYVETSFSAASFSDLLMKISEILNPHNFASSVDKNY